MSEVMYLRPTVATVTETNLTDEAYPIFNISTTYAKNDRVISDTQIYISRVNENTGNTPLTYPLFWKLEGTVNTLAAFDPHFFTQSYANNEITYTISAPSVDTIAFANLEATEIVVELLDENDAVIETKTSGLVTVNGDDWIDYWFNPLSYATKEVIYVPIAVSSKIKIKIKNPGSIAKVGNLGIGMRTTLGCEKYGTKVSSRLVKDPYGTKKVVEDVSMSLDIDSNLRIAEVDEIARIGDKFTFYFFGYESGEIVCAKATNPESIHEDFTSSTLNLELEGIK